MTATKDGAQPDASAKSETKQKASSGPELAQPFCQKPLCGNYNDGQCPILLNVLAFQPNEKITGCSQHTDEASAANVYPPEPDDEPQSSAS